MSKERTLLDRSESHTDTGVGLLRIAAGLFFLLPGIFKIVAPDVFLAMTANFPPFLQPHLGWLFDLVIVAEVIGGLMLIVGWNIRLAVPALVVITVVAESLVVVNDSASSIRLLSLSAHFMGAGLYSAMFFLGSGRWAIGRGRSVLHWLAARNLGRLSKVAHEVTSGAGKNVGVFLIRASVSIPFIAAFWLGLTDAAYQSVLLEPDWLRNALLVVSLIGGLSMLTGFQANTMGWVLAALALLHLVTVGIADAPSSQIGMINILFHLLIIAAVVSLRLINFGSDLRLRIYTLSTKRM